MRTVKAVAPGFGGINLEDISAPRCFEIERRLREELDIPVFHDDQHGTAVVVLAAFLNALRVVGKRARGRLGRDRRRRRRRHRVHQDPARGGRPEHHRRRPLGRDPPRPRRASTRSSAGTPSTRTSQGFTGHVERGAARAPTSSSGSPGPGAVSVDAVLDDGRRRDRLRDGEPDARGAAGGARRPRRRDRDRPLRLPEPDQQRARLPGHLPRRARRARERDQRGDEARRRRGARLRRRARRALGRVRDPERLQPRGRRDDRRGRGAGRDRRAASPAATARRARRPRPSCTASANRRRLRAGPCSTSPGSCPGSRSVPGSHAHATRRRR